MGYEININGTIDGISKDSFELIEEDLFDVFSEVCWMENAIEIYSSGNHRSGLDSVFNKIAFCIDGDGSGQLDIQGEDRDDMSIVFFAPRKWKQLYADIVYPENPF